MLECLLTAVADLCKLSPSLVAAYLGTPSLTHQQLCSPGSCMPGTRAGLNKRQALEAQSSGWATILQYCRGARSTILESVAKEHFEVPSSG